MKKKSFVKRDGIIKQALNFFKQYGVFKMEYKEIGRLHEESCATVEVVYGVPTKKEAEDFVRHLKNFDQKNETGKFRDFVRIKIVRAVRLGYCFRERVLIEARYLHFYYVKKKKEAA